jgi:hypothetical protein
MCTPSTENKNGDTKDSFYEEWECVFDHFPTHQTRISLGNFDAKAKGRERDRRYFQTDNGESTFT